MQRREDVCAQQGHEQGQGRAASRKASNAVADSGSRLPQVLRRDSSIHSRANGQEGAAPWLGGCREVALGLLRLVM
jgi:hypothetical protein